MTVTPIQRVAGLRRRKAPSDEQLVRDSLTKIAEAAAGGEYGRLRQLIRQHLRDASPRRLAAKRVLASAQECPNPTGVEELAASLDPFRPYGGPVPWHFMQKDNGRVRPICELPSDLKAIHYVIKDVLWAAMRPGDHVFNVRRRGRDSEARAIKEALEGGYRFVFTGDIKDAFQAINVDALYDLLPLPKAVIRYALDYRELQLTPTVTEGQGSPLIPDDVEDTTSQSTHNATGWARQRREGTGCPLPMHNTPPRRRGPRGILQGSPASNLILAWLLNGMPAAVCRPGGVLFLFADDILIAAKTEAVCRRMETLLVRYLSEHRAGPLLLGRSEFHEVPETALTATAGAFDHLGYSFELNRAGEIEIGRSPRRLEKMYGKLNKALAEDLAASEDGQLPPFRALLLLSQILGGYRAITNMAETEAELTHQVLGLYQDRIWARSGGGS